MQYLSSEAGFAVFGRDATRIVSRGRRLHRLRGLHRLHGMQGLHRVHARAGVLLGYARPPP